MQKIMTLLGRNSLRVNYFTFLVLGVLFNVLGAFLPFGVNVVVAPVFKFLMVFSIAMFATRELKVIRIAFWGLVAIALVNIFSGLTYGLLEFMRNPIFSSILNGALALLYLLLIVMVLRHALPKMRSIVVSLLVLEVYNAVVRPLLYVALPAALTAADSPFTMIGWTIVPFLLMIPLFILIAKNGKEKW